MNIREIRGEDLSTIFEVCIATRQNRRRNSHRMQMILGAVAGGRIRTVCHLMSETF